VSLYTVIFTPEAQEQMAALYRYIASAASPEISERYTSSIIAYCESLRGYPLRGTCRDDVRPGLRITHYKKCAVDKDLVSILGIFYGGQAYETVLQSDFD